MKEKRDWSKTNSIIATGEIKKATEVALFFTAESDNQSIASPNTDTVMLAVTSLCNEMVSG